MKEARLRFQIDEFGKETCILETKDGERWSAYEIFYLKQIDGEYEYIDCWILGAMMLLQEKGYFIKISY